MKYENSISLIISLGRVGYSAIGPLILRSRDRQLDTTVKYERRFCSTMQWRKAVQNIGARSLSN